MNYKIQYSCCSHKGRVRRINQDNYICNGEYYEMTKDSSPILLKGCVSSEESPVFGVFDGLGGEECGEIASLIAAKCGTEIILGKDPVGALLDFCEEGNARICDYAQENQVSAMGTTAAMLAFSEDAIALCNIGDSKVFRLTDNKIEQLSQDHYGVGAYNRKPPLSQCLGIPPAEIIIEPYVAKEHCRNGDIYLICSDGLTDMVTTEEILGIIQNSPFKMSVESLISKALEHGGKDNITVILCRLEEEKTEEVNVL